MAVKKCLEGNSRPSMRATLHGYGSIFLWCVALIGCASTPEVADVESDTPLKSGIWEVKTGQRLDFDGFVDRLEGAPYVIVGESHGTKWHHRVQTDIYAELSARRPGDVALGMEMVERRFQEPLDAYIEGRIDEEQMLSKVRWESRWGVDYKLYAPMWRTARDDGQPVVGLNARRELVRAVGEVGLEGLDEKQRAELPDMEVKDEEYREHLRRIFAAHGNREEVDEEGLDRFFEAQLVWDETMAQTAFEFLEGEGAEQIVILTGRGHMERGFGIPSGLQWRGVADDEMATVVGVVTEGPRAEMMEEYRDLRFLKDEEIADFVWVE